MPGTDPGVRSTP